MAIGVPNLHHNLVQQLSELVDSIWRYEHFYKTDAEGCEACKALWGKLHERHLQDVADLKAHIADHVKMGDW